MRSPVAFSILAVAVAAADCSALQPLLTTIAGIDDLSVFSDAVTDSGGPKPNPAFEERFNSPLDGRNYTAFVPTNAAFAKIPKAALDTLLSTPAYELFEAIIRTHIAEGLFPSPSPSTPIISIEGFPIMSSTSSKGTLLNNQSLLLPDPPVPASNGLIHRIDQLLNPFTSYFGVSTADAHPSFTGADGTIYDLVQNDPRLSAFKEKLSIISPRALDRLDLHKPNGEWTIVALPSNDAFAVLPQQAMPAFVAPSNRALSEFILTAGFLAGGKKLTELGLGKAGDEAKVEGGLDGWELKVRVGERGGVRLNNAAVQGEVCVENGCVWLVDRVVDSLFEVFGEDGRTA
ncbi:FAS1 domain-containing protein [Elsinoe ampelina]|uniref:FAS1 domain-containing protein n=1 Tax=Elsinoe ampelina TaxID=302913 RepID=A0A6A6GBZ8_9PEZI|nr:FAS1 domain-containing protein [Elsinoe ampelina]